MKLVCPNCGTQRESGKYCPDCGAKLQEVVPGLVCPSCGYKAKTGKFCPECGAKLTGQQVAPNTVANKESAKRTFNVKDPRIAKYYDTKGLPRSITPEERALAIEDLTPFANQDVAEAKMLLGCILMNDSNKDAFLKGLKLLKEAEEAGDKLAYYRMGILYFYGDDTVMEQNYDESEKRLLEAYQEYQGGDIAGLLAKLYTSCTEKCDYKKAFDYATIAVENDESEGYFVLGSLCLHGWGVEKDSSLALDKYKMAAAYGDETAMNQIGYIFMGDNDFEANPEQSFYWFNEAAKKGSDVGMFNLGCCYKNGFGIQADIEQAAEWFKKSAELGYVDAMYELGEYYQDALVDYNKAKQWYHKAAGLGHGQAQNNLGVLYADIENNYKEAIKWYKKAMEQNAPSAYRNYALCLWKGNGIRANKKKAMEAMQSAISLGCPDAENELKEMQQSFSEKKKEGEKVSKASQSKSKQIKEKIEEVLIKNVKFSTDGRKTLFVEFECEYNQNYCECDIDFSVYAGKKANFVATDMSGLGSKRSKNREKFSFNISDYELNLMSKKTNNISFLIEARHLDARWDGTQDVRKWPLLASYKTKLKLYYEYHIFGKNILLIK